MIPRLEGVTLPRCFFVYLPFAVSHLAPSEGRIFHTQSVGFRSKSFPVIHQVLSSYLLRLLSPSAVPIYFVGTSCLAYTFPSRKPFSILQSTILTAYTTDLSLVDSTNTLTDTTASKDLAVILLASPPIPQPSKIQNGSLQGHSCSASNFWSSSGTPSGCL